MDKKICATCVYWDHHNHKSEDKFYSCSCEKFFFGYHNKEENVPNDGAMIEDDVGWGMLTGPEFGCIHWATK